jgi:hypothetical protein
MHSITEEEAVGIRTLLAALPVSERKRISESGLGSRTFERIRKRAYAAGWVFDRFVPNPARAGYPTVSFVLARPFAEQIEEVQRRWKDLPSNVLLWRWPETVFGVFFSSEPQQGFLAKIDSRVGEKETTVVTSSATRHAIPVYFDFEGAWALWTGQLGTLAYPHSIPATPIREDLLRGHRGPDPGAMAGLLARPFLPAAETSPLRVSPFFFPRSYQRLLETGLVQRRTFLDPQKVPPFEGRSLGRVAFVQGELLSAGTEESLFRMLMAIQVRPFLFCRGNSRVLLATLARAPSDVETRADRPTVLGNLRRYLTNIQIVREPIEALSVVVNHRYDRLFPGPTSRDHPT